MSTNDDDRDRAVLPFDGSGSDGDGDAAAGAARLIRRQWYDGRWFFSVVDVVAVLTDSDAPRQYWAMLKKRLRDEGADEPLTNCVQLKMRALDGKMRVTDAADAETMLRIVQSIPSPKAEPIKQFLARAGAERLEDVAESDILAGLTPEQRAIFLRGQMAERNLSLAEAAAVVGVVTNRDFAVFQDFGYIGLYNGERARDIAARKGLKRGQAILDWMGPDELVANLFRASQTEQRLRREPIQGKTHANHTHFEVGRAVRNFIIAQGNTPPEQMPTPEKSIQQLQRDEAKRLEAERQPSLFPEPAPERAEGQEGGNA